MFVSLQRYPSTQHNSVPRCWYPHVIFLTRYILHSSLSRHSPRMLAPSGLQLPQGARLRRQVRGVLGEASGRPVGVRRKRTGPSYGANISSLFFLPTLAPACHPGLHAGASERARHARPRRCRRHRAGQLLRPAARKTALGKTCMCLRGSACGMRVSTSVC